MAEREDINKRILSINPKAKLLLNELDRLSEPGVTVTTTEGMPPEEEEMSLFTGFLKEGYPPEEAERKAKEWLSIMNSF